MRVLEKEKYHLDKVKVNQELNEDDLDRRQELCELMINRMLTDLHFIQCWSGDYPHWMMEAHTLKK